MKLKEILGSSGSFRGKCIGWNVAWGARLFARAWQAEEEP